MADPQGFSATKFIKKQYNKDSPPSSAISDSPPVDEKDSPQELSPEAIRAILRQYLSSADRYIQEGRIWESIGMYNAALHLAPQDLDILQNLANTYVKANARIKAVETFTKIAGLYERQGLMEKGNEIYEKIYGIDPTNKLACGVLGRTPGQDTPHLDMYTTPPVENKPPTARPQPETRDQRLETRDSEPVVPMSEFKKPSEDDVLTVIQREPPTPAQMEGPRPVEEVIPLEKLSVITPAHPVAKPETREPKPVDTAGPKPVEEIIPFDKLTVPPVPPKPVVPVQEKVVVKVEPKSVEELIPFPPMPEKKVVVTATVSSEPVKESPEVPVVKEEFPLPLPEIKAVEHKPIVMPIPEKKVDVIVSAPAPQISPLAPANERMQYNLDILAMDPENIEARLNYINAFLEIGMEAELVDDYLELANCYRGQGKLEEAIKYYQKVLEFAPNIEIAKRRLAQCKGEPQPEVKNASGTFAPSIPDASIAIPSGSDTSSNLDANDEAHINQFRRLLLINPINEPIARKLASIYLNKNMKKEAVAEMVLLADAYMQKGMYSKAVPIYEEMVKESPEAELREKLAKAQSLHKSMNAINQAIKSYKTELKV